MLPSLIADSAAPVRIEDTCEDEKCASKAPPPRLEDELLMDALFPARDPSGAMLPARSSNARVSRISLVIYIVMSKSKI